MNCEVVASRTVSSGDRQSLADTGNGAEHAPGTTLVVDYKHDTSNGLTIYLGEPNRANVLIEEPFPASSFEGVSRFTNVAEYRNTYSEVSFGRHGMNYKGNDQLFLKEKCRGGDWSGHFVQTSVSGHFTQVVSLRCQPFVHVIDDVFARLKADIGN
ncbi:hypothetical protein [Tropicimonas marinistellae]|uniref:hypothetical protein n=1 Tax=Tropicimonas marinistellae TaxID=1739787 RepID=UPI00122E1A01|nr:hypothetical protein [Tropicimonas marinistellae]